MKIKKTSLKDSLKGILYSEEIEKLGSAFDVVGDIIILELDESLKSKEKEIAEALFKTNKSVKTVLKKKGIHKGVYRLQEYDFVLCEGLNRESLSLSILQDLNMSISKNLGAPFISVFNAKEMSEKDIYEELRIENEELRKQGCFHFASFINRVDKDMHDSVKDQYKEIENNLVLPELADLDFITVGEVLQKLHC